MRTQKNQSRFIEMSSSWRKQGVIRDLVDDKITRASKRFTPSDIIQYIDISSVDGESNHVTSTTEYQLSDAPSRAQQCTVYGDILVSTVRPNLKNVAINQIVGDNTVASSGFCVLRPRTGYQGLLLAYVLSEPFTEKMVAEAKGSNYPAIHDSDVLSYPITIPEESDLEKIDGFIRQSDKSKFNGFKSRFIEMFQDAPKTKLGDFCELKARIGWQGLKHEEFLDNGDYYLVTGVDFTGTSIDWSRCHFVTKERYDQDPYIQLHNGDILVTKDGTIGKVAIVSGLETPATLNSGVFVLRDKKGLTLNSFLFYCLLSKEFERFVEDCKTGSTIAHLNQKAFVNYLIPTPELKAQEQFVSFATQADKSKYLS